MISVKKPIQVAKGQPPAQALVVGQSFKSPVVAKKFMGEPDAPPAVGKKKPGKITIVDGQVAAKPGSFLQSVALDRETVFGSLYQQEGMSGALRCPYDPDHMAELVETNNALDPCIQAMETNVDGTGFEIIADDDAVVPDKTLKTMKAFFNEPWAGTSFLSMRKQLRRDVETTGNWYVEVIRNVEGQMALVRRMDPYVTRIMRLGNDSYLQDVWSPLLNQFVQVSTRRRRYVQYIFGRLVYFKDFKAPLDLNRETGVWGDKLAVPPDKLANEVIHGVVRPHHVLPYGIPRWVNQIPSVLGSRRAEEFNLGFFDQGGIPPMLIIIQGGQAADTVEKAMKDLMYSPGPQKTTAAVLQVQATGGDLNTPGNVRVTVERFGSERQKDQMFEKYDENCEIKIRRSWRLPPIFVGSVKEVNFANALASYRMAEAQVFKPERDKFDEKITTTILYEIAGDNLRGKIRFRSLPIVARDMQQQILGMTLAVQYPTGPAITPEELVDNLNEITGLALNAATPAEKQQMAQDKAVNDAMLGKGGAKGNIQSDGSASIEGFTEPAKGAAGVDKSDVDKSEVMAESLADALFNGNDRNAFDSVAYLDRNPQVRDHAGPELAKRLFCCAPDEAESASALAMAVIRHSAVQSVATRR